MTTRPKSLESLCFFQLDPVYQLHWTMEQMLDTIVLEIGSKDPNELKQACRKSNASLFFKITQPIPGGLFIPYLFPQRVQEKPRVYREPISVDPSPQSQVKTRESTRLEEAQNSLEEQHNTERTEKHHTPFVPSQLTPPAKLNLSKLKLPTAPSSRPSQKSSSTYPRLLDHVKQLTKPTPAQLEQHKLDPHRSIMNSFRANNANVYLSSLVFFEEFFRLHMSKGEDATESQDSNPPDNQMSLTHSLFFLLSCLSSLSHSAQRHAVHEFHLELRDYSSGVNRSCLQNQIGNPNLKQTGLVKETARMVFEMEEAELVEKDNRMILERDHVDRSRNHSWTTGGSLKRNDLGRAIDANLFEVAESRIDRLEAEWQKEIAKKDRRSWHRITRRSFFQIVRTITPRFKPAQAPKPRLDTLQDPSHQTVRDPSQQTQQSPPEAPHKVDAHVLMRDLEDYIQNTSHPDEDIARMGEWVDAHRACDAMTQIMRLEYELEMRSLWVMSLLQRNAALPSLPRDSITDLPVTLTYSTQPKFSVPLDSLHVGGLILHPVSCQLTLPSSTDFTASILQSDGLTQDSLASLLSSLKVPSITVTFFSPHFRTIFRNAWRTFFCTDNTFFTTDLGKELFPPVAAPAEPQRPPSNSFFSQAILPDKHDPHPYKFEQTRNFPSRTGVKNFSPFFRILECDFPFTSPEMFIEFMSFFSFVYVQTEADDPNKFLTFVLPLSSLIAPDKPGYSFFPIGSTSSGLAVFHPPNQQRFEMEQPQTQEPVPEALSSQSWMDKINNDDDTKTSSSPLSAKTDGDNSISRGQPIFTPSTVLAHPHKRETSLHLAQEVPSDCEGWKQMRRQIHSFYGAKHSPPFSPTSYHDSENWIVFYFSDEHLSKDYAQLEQIEREYVTGPERERGLSLDKLIERSRQKMIDLQHRTKNMFVIPSEFVYLLLKHHIFLMLRDFLHLFPPFHSTYHRVLSFFFSSPFNPSLPSTFPFRLITEDWMAWLMKGPMYLRIATPPTQTILEKKQARFSSKPSLLSLQNSLPAVRLHVSHSVSFDLWSASFRRKTPPQPVRPNGDQKRPDAPSTSLTPLFPYPPPPEEPKAKTLCDILISPSIAKDLKRPSELLPSSPMIPIIFRRQHSLVRFFGRDEDDTLAVYPPGSNCVDQMNVTAFDAFRLNQGRFINDNILSFYTRLLNDLLIVDERGTKWEWNQNSADSSSPLHFNNPMQLLPLAQKRRREELSNRFYFFNTFFYRYLRNGQTAWHRLVESHARNSQRESASAKHKEKKGEPVGFIQTLFGNLLSKRPKEFSNHVRREIDGGGGDEMLRDDSSPDPPSRSSHNGTTTLPSGRLPHPQFTPPTLSRPARTPLFSPNDPSHSTPNHLSLLETMKVITPGELSNEDSESDSEGFDRDEFLQNLDREMPLFSQPSTQPENDDNMSEPDVMSQGDFFSNTYDAETPTPIELKPDWDESEDDKRRQRGHTELLPEEEEFIPPSLSPRLPFSYSVPYIGEKTVWQSSPSLDQLPLHRRMIRVYEEMHHTFSEIPPTSLFGPLQPSSHQTDTNTNGCADFYASEFHRNLFYPFTDPFSHDARSEQPAFSLSTPLTSDSTFFLPLLLPFSTFSRSIQKDPPKSLLPTSLQSVSVDPVTLIPRVPNSLKHTLAPFPPEHLFSKVEDLSSYNSVRMWTRHNDLFSLFFIFSLFSSFSQTDHLPPNQRRLTLVADHHHKSWDGSRQHTFLDGELERQHLRHVQHLGGDDEGLPRHPSPASRGQRRSPQRRHTA
ncbi:hypothetical protein BLNAU_16622 [Blattamonas nauphoetae]|uniref:UDENN domain-containing protein n=1 Tax=Blattamonas nauphoetae TaxID=2049346 RepID=A0ABQ9X879_9EUKA|nr:hypothetical protein BLNAU_16622 [Blattamonas nauphoetae]